MKSKKQKDLGTRERYQKTEPLRRALSKVLINDSIPKCVRDEATNHLDKLGRRGSISLVRNRCVVSGRSRGVYSTVKVSRIVLREKALGGEFYGIKKY